MSFWRLYRDDVHGSIAVEGAILFPLMFTLGFGAIDGAMLLLQNHKMEQGLVAGANYLARANNPDIVQTQAKNFAVSGSPTGQGQSRVTGWDAADITLTFRNVDNSTGQYRAGSNVRIAELSSSHPYAGFGFIRLVSGGRVMVNARHEERLVRAR